MIVDPGRCDFCSSTEIKWRYPAKSFTIGEYGSLGDWAACEECSRLIEMNAHDDLARRTLQASGHFTEYKVFKPLVVKLHKEFRKNRTGHRQPDGPGPGIVVT
jgi:hypothetical protein